MTQLHEAAATLGLGVSRWQLGTSDPEKLHGVGVPTGLVTELAEGHLGAWGLWAGAGPGLVPEPEEDVSLAGVSAWVGDLQRWTNRSQFNHCRELCPAR